MTYYLVMFVQPKPSPDPGVLKYRITRNRYEQLCELENATVDCGKGNFTVISKRIFPLEIENVAVICVDVLKNRKE